MSVAREMTLDEYLEGLYSHHLARRQLAALRAENAKLAKLNAAYWAEIQSYRRDAYCLNDEGKATDAARKEAGL